MPSNTTTINNPVLKELHERLSFHQLNGTDDHLLALRTYENGFFHWGICKLKLKEVIKDKLNFEIHLGACVYVEGFVPYLYAENSLIKLNRLLDVFGTFTNAGWDIVCDSYKNDDEKWIVEFSSFGDKVKVVSCVGEFGEGGELSFESRNNEMTLELDLDHYLFIATCLGKE